MKLAGNWRYLGSSVYERRDGLRAAVGGMCRLVDGTVVSASIQYDALNRFIRINGGNRKRAVMAWAADQQAQSIKH